MRASLCWAVAGAVALHVAAIWTLGGASHSSRRVDVPHIATAEKFDARVIRVAVAPAAERPAFPRNATSHPAATGRSTPRPDESASSKEVEDPSPLYLESGALDQTAEPVGEWVLDTSLLPPNGEITFQVAIWVSARGEIEKWEVTSASVNEELSAAIFARLNDTVMNPALVGTKPVASMLRFELRAERQ